MFNRVPLFLLLTFLLLSGCFSSESVNRNTVNRLKAPTGFFNLPQQKVPPDAIQSIQLYKTGSPSNPPVITLDSDEKLILEFDHLASSLQQFKLTVSHRNKDWRKSPLPPNFYMSGFYEVFFGDGKKSFTQRPSYYHYKYEFPNSQLSFKTSGNYLLSVYSSESNELLFSIPFFVTEDEGKLNTEVEQLFGQRDDLRAQDQLFSSYQYPPFVEFPRFDLSFYYIQNQFWGRAKKVNILDTSSPGLVNFHLNRESSFLSDYEFNSLDLSTVTVDGESILEVQRGETPTKVVLRRDVESLDPVPRFFPDSRFGLPVHERDASYFDVLFSLETPGSISDTAKIYLVGDFNNWFVRPENEMQYSSERNIREGNALIKQGEYAYKYVIVRRGLIDDLSLGAKFAITRQKYITLVYFKDPARNFDRLLKATQITAR